VLAQLPRLSYLCLRVTPGPWNEVRHGLETTRHGGIDTARPGTRVGVRVCGGGQGCGSRVCTAADRSLLQPQRRPSPRLTTQPRPMLELACAHTHTCEFVSHVCTRVCICVFDTRACGWQVHGRMGRISAGAALKLALSFPAKQVRARAVMPVKQKLDIDTVMWLV
jgi:hypothetical protein